MYLLDGKTRFIWPTGIETWAQFKASLSRKIKTYIYEPVFFMQYFPRQDSRGKTLITCYGLNQKSGEQ